MAGSVSTRPCQEADFLCAVPAGQGQLSAKPRDLTLPPSSDRRAGRLSVPL